MRVLGYCCAADQDPSLEEQQAALERFCQKGNHTLVATFIDADPSSPHRPQFQALLERLRSSQQGFLVTCPEAHVLGAGLAETLARILELETADAQVVCTDPELPDPLQSALAHWTRRGSPFGRGERIREAMRNKAIRGEGLGKPPYGYCIGQAGKLEEQPGEAEVVRHIFHLYTQEDLGIRRIARSLNEAGMQTRRGQPWSMVTIRDILRNRVYLGTYSRFGMLVPASHPPLIAREVHQQAQEQMQRKSVPRHAVRREPFLLSGLVYCADCGNRMIGVTRRQRWRRQNGQQMEGVYRYYQCQSRTNQSRCQYHTWRVAVLEEQVKQHILDRAAMAGSRLTMPAATRPREDAAQRIRRLERRLLQALRQAAAGTASRSALRETLEVLQRSDYSLPVQEATDPRANQPLTPAMLEAAWASRTPAELQALLCHLIQRVFVQDQAIQVTLH